MPNFKIHEIALESIAKIQQMRHRLVLPFTITVYFDAFDNVVSWVAYAFPFNDRIAIYNHHGITYSGYNADELMRDLSADSVIDKTELYRWHEGLQRYQLYKIA